MASQTNWIEINAFVQWARVFESNRDTAEKAKTDHKGVIKYLQKYDGEYKVDVFPATQADLDKAKANLSEKLYGKGNPRFVEVEDGPGMGVKFQLSRRHSDTQTWKDKKTGEDKVIDFGGQPEIVWWNEDKGFGTKWDFGNDGLIGNGSYVKIKFTVYGQPGNPTESDTVRLEKIGVIDQVVYNSEGSGF